MKETLKNLAFIMLIIIGISCSEDKLNEAPNIKMKSPADGTEYLSIDKAPILRWESDGESFDVYCDTEFPPITKVNTETVDAKEFTLYKLKSNTKYYWKIVAKNRDVSSENQTWSFTTTNRNSSSWNKKYNVPRYGYRGNSIIEAKDGGLILLEANDSGERYAWKLNRNGEEVWKLDLPIIPKNSSTIIIKNINDGFAILCRIKEKNSYTFIKLSEECVLESSITQQLKPFTSISSAIQTKDGSYTLIGEQVCTNSSNHNIWYSKTDNIGRIIWDETFGDDSSNQTAKAITEAEDGCYAISGYSSKNIFSDKEDINSTYSLLIKIDPNGYVIFNDKGTYGEEYDQTGETLVKASNDDIVMGCNTNSNDSNMSQLLIQRINKEGKSVRAIFGGAKQDLIKKIIATEDGGFAILSTTWSETKGKTDIWLIKTDSNLKKVWDKKFGGSGMEKAISLIQTFDGGYAILGSSIRENNREYGWIIKTDEEGLVEIL